MRRGIFFLSAILLIPRLVSSQTCHEDQSDEFWKIGGQYGSKLISACHPNAIYNCHGFVMSYFENGCTQTKFIGEPIQAPYTCPNVQGNQPETAYQQSSRYVRVCSESVGEIVFYHTYASVPGNHSAVKQIVDAGAGTYKYISKYGNDGPLVGHDLNGSVYHLKGQIDLSYPPEFWVFIGNISGNTNITGTSPVSFSVLNKPEVNYSWSVVSGGSNIYITSGGNQSNVTLQPLHSGNAVLRLTTSSNCTAPKNKDITLSIQTGICLEGFYDNAGIYNKNLYTTNNVVVGGVAVRVSCPNATSITWQKTSGNINGYFPPGNNISFTMTSGGNISFLVTAKNGSTTLATRNVAFYNYGSFMIYPNPADNELSIELNAELEFSITLTSLDRSGESITLNQFKGDNKIDTSGLKNGEYSMRIFHDGKLIHQQHLLIKR